MKWNDQSNVYSVLDNKNRLEEEKEHLISEIVSVYMNEIPNITHGINMYELYTKTDYDGDMNMLKAKLINYIDNLAIEEKNEIMNWRQLNCNKEILMYLRMLIIPIILI